MKKIDLKIDTRTGRTGKMENHHSPSNEMKHELPTTMISSLRNLGNRSQTMLAVAGITSVSQLRKVGSAAAFVAVKRAGRKPSLNLLWSIEGALTDHDWKEVAKNDRLSLLTQIELLERNNPAP